MILQTKIRYHSKGKLKDDLICRHDLREYFTEEELVQHLFKLTKLFNRLQKMGISHRNINPDSFYISEDDDLILAEFDYIYN
jgi:serine/threonine protein kinase